MDYIGNALNRILKAIFERKSRKIPFRVPFNSAIDWFLDEASASEELPDSGIHVLKYDEVNSNHIYIVGVDGSSRRFSTPYGGFALATVSVTWGPLPVGDYPPLGYIYPLKIPIKKPFISTYSSILKSEEINSICITVTSPSGSPYEEEGEKGVSLADMAHEIRTTLETYGLEIATKSLECLGIDDKFRIIVLDGPLYQRPWKRELMRNPILRADWEVLTKERVKVLKNLWQERELPVVASVKRLEKSRYLVHIHGTLMNYINTPFPKQDNDVAEAYALADVYVREKDLKGLDPLLIGPFLICPSALGVPEGIEAPNIVYAYLIFPVMPYNGKLDNVHKCILRLEVLEDVYNKYGVNVFKRCLRDISLYKGLFTSQYYADSRCRECSKVLFIYTCKEAMNMGVELSYDTRLYLSMIQGGEDVE